MLVNQGDMTLEVTASTQPAVVGIKRNLSDATIINNPLHGSSLNPGRILPYATPDDLTRYSSPYSLSLPIKYKDKKIGLTNITDTTRSNRGSQQNSDYKAR